ncbi:MAG: protein-glutamate O-methyltransferase CheR [Clostridiales Family XIII bacterium]|jgi:chemotaxis protein methyltransferase CheR|nr:protein-glutamate O-methyltransferase CheR [Clostridiales Family XIII bacterium]
MIPSLTDDEFREISEYINKNYGVDLTKKRLLIEGRLGQYIAELGFKNYHDYFIYATHRHSSREIANLINRLMTSHSFFMREKDHFEFYRSHVLPWVDRELGDRDLRVWSAGCSSGQEPYTLSIIAMEYFSMCSRATDTVILASDISEEALRRARRGIYSSGELAALPHAWRVRWFREAGAAHFRVNEELRANVAFKCANLLDDMAAKKPFHLIMCRNVMIYFDAETKNRVLGKFYDALRSGGYLFVGHSETISLERSGFAYVAPSIYRKP